MHYTYNDELCIKETYIKDKHAKTKAVIKNIVNTHFTNITPSTKYYKILYEIEISKRIASLEELAQSIRSSYKDVIIIAMGGASLNPQSVVALRLNNSTPKFHFLDSTDPRKLTQLLSKVRLQDTACLVFSNSGETIETTAGLTILLNIYQKNNLPNIKDHFFFITGSSDNSIRKIANELGSVIIDHEPDISGRYATFTNITLLPGLIAGLNMHAFLAGANSVLKDLRTNHEESIPALAAATLFSAQLPLHITISYLENLSSYLRWYAQIESESLGKKGKGFTPVYGIGPMDQHSMFQLYLDGPGDKLYTFYYVQDNQTNYQALKTLNNFKPEYLANKGLAEINSAMLQASIESLTSKNLPVRTIILNSFAEECMGALMMHSAIETIILGHLMQNNPFDQPEVEYIKTAAKKLLQN